MAILEVQRLTHTYPDGTQALRGVDVEVEAGEFVAVLGPNGSGKTTLFKHLVALLNPTTGRVLLNGFEVGARDSERVHQSVGFVFQDPNDQLFMTTVEEDVAFGPRNLRLPPEEVSRRVERCLEMVGLPDLRSKSIHSLSFGQKRRVALAGVLAMEPRVVVLDEPTAGLDPLGTSRIMRLLRRLNREQGITMIMATHDIDIVPVYADRAYVLSRGEVVSSGTLRDVFSRIDVIRDSELRLPRVAHLLEVISSEFGQPLDELPLTIGQAQQWILRRRRRNEGLPEELWHGRRRGYSTGACAAAAAQAAATALFLGRTEKTANIQAPGGVVLSIPVAESALVSSPRGKAGRAIVIKDSGDEPDVTHGAEICVEVETTDTPGVTIEAGTGIGRVTRPGLSVEVGRPAINPVPLRMIERAVAELLPDGLGAQVTVSIPRGEELSRKTLNARLGIEGGLSILGTTGLVTPDSEESYKAALARQIDLALAAGQETLYLVPGDAGERFVIETLRAPREAVVWTSNFVGYMLQQCVRRGVKHAVLAGHIGKLAKVAAGIFQTHNRVADARLETIAAYAALEGASQEITSSVLRAETAEAASQLLLQHGYGHVFQTLSRRAADRATSYVGGAVTVECILISLRGEILGCTVRGLHPTSTADAAVRSDRG